MLFTSQTLIYSFLVEAGNENPPPKAQKLLPQSVNVTLLIWFEAILYSAPQFLMVMLIWLPTSALHRNTNNLNKQGESAASQLEGR